MIYPQSQYSELRQNDPHYTTFTAAEIIRSLKSKEKQLPFEQAKTAVATVSGFGFLVSGFLFLVSLPTNDFNFDSGLATNDFNYSPTSTSI